MLRRIGLQSSDKYVHYYYYGDGVTQRFVVKLGGRGLVHITIVGYVNKLTTLDALF